MPNNNRYVKNIRDIVGIDPNQSVLPSADRKSTLFGNRGIAFRSSDGQNSSSATAPAESNAVFYLMPPNPITLRPDIGSGHLNPLDPNSPGNEVDPNDPLLGIFEREQGTYDANDLLQNLADATLQSGLFNGISQTLLPGGGTINGINGLKFPGTSDYFSARLDGFVYPPEGWYNETTPGNEYEQWEQGFYWLASMPPAYPDSTEYYFTASDAAEDILNYVPGGYTLESITLGSNPSFTQYDFTYVHDTLSDLVYFATKRTCSVMDPDDDAVCTATHDIPHPIDNVHQLIWNRGGRFETNPYEPPEDIIAALTDDQHSTLEFDYGPGSDTGRLQPSIDGGWLLGSTTATNGDFTGVVMLIGGDGKVKQYLTADQAQYYIPR